MLLFIGAMVLVSTFLMATGSGASLYLSRHYLVLGYVLLPLVMAVDGRWLAQRFARQG